MLRHVWNCEHLSKGLYWCFQCQKPERVGSFKCKRCHGGHSTTDRIATVARKMFSALGSKRVVERCSPPSTIEKPSSLSKISEAAEGCESWDDGLSEIGRAPVNRDAHLEPPSMPELPNTGIWEMDATYVMSEMDGSWDFSQELPDSEVSGFSNERRTSIPRPYAPWNLSEKAPAGRESPRPSRSLLPRLNTHTVLEPMKQKQLYSPIPSLPENPMSATIVSPLSPTGGFDFGTLGPIDISPTDSETSDKSLFTDSGYSSATFESSWNGSVMNFESMVTRQKEKNTREKDSLECGQDYDTFNFGKAPSVFPQMSSDNELTVYGAMTTTHSADRCTSTQVSRALSPHWTNAKSLVASFSEVLNEHLQHSQRSLQEMAPNSITKELLSLSSSSIVSIGFGVLEGLLQGRRPHAVMPLFAFTHIAYALAIAVDHDESKVHTPEWFQDLFSMLDNISSDRQRQTYTQIVRVIWQPRDAAELTTTMASGTAETENRLIRACKHFLDGKTYMSYCIYQC